MINQTLLSTILTKFTKRDTHNIKSENRVRELACGRSSLYTRLILGGEGGSAKFCDRCSPVKIYALRWLQPLKFCVQSFDNVNYSIHDHCLIWSNLMWFYPNYGQFPKMTQKCENRVKIILLCKIKWLLVTAWLWNLLAKNR